MYSLTLKLQFIESIFGAGRLASNGKNFDIRCPICASTNSDKKKLVIRVDDDVNHCWVCGFKAHTLAPLIRKFGTQAQLLRYRDEFMPESSKNSSLFVNDDDDCLNEKIPLTLPSDFQLLTLASMIDPDVAAAWSYIRARGITKNDAWYFKLGISNDRRWRRRIIVPSFDCDGKLNYYVARNIDEFDRRPKYDNPDENKLPIIFNELNVDWSKRLVICEGTFDMMKCGENVVPLLGSDLNEESKLFSQIISNNTPIALALDGDMWRTKTPKIIKKLQEYDVDVVLVDVREHGDPGKMSKQQFRDALSLAIAPTWESTFLDKLSFASETKLRLKRDVKRIDDSYRSFRAMI